MLYILYLDVGLYSSHYENYRSITKILIADNIAENFISFLIPMPIIVVYTNGERAT